MANIATLDTRTLLTKLSLTLKPTIFLGKGGTPPPKTGQMWPRGSGNG